MDNNYVIKYDGALEEIETLGISYVVLDNKIVIPLEDDMMKWVSGTLTDEELLAKYNNPTTLEILHTKVHDLVNGSIPSSSYTWEAYCGIDD